MYKLSVSGLSPALIPPGRQISLARELLANMLAKTGELSRERERERRLPRVGITVQDI